MKVLEGETVAVSWRFVDFNVKILSREEHPQTITQISNPVALIHFGLEKSSFSEKNWSTRVSTRSRILLP